MPTAPALNNVPLNRTPPIQQQRPKQTPDSAPPEFMAAPQFTAGPQRVAEPRLTAEPFVIEDPEGWIAAGDLIAGEQLGSLFELPQRLWDAPTHAAVVLAWKIYTYRLAQPLAVAWAHAREIPLLSPDNVMLQFLPGAPYINIGLRRGTSAVLSASPASRSRDAVVLPDHSAQIAYFSSTLIDGHLRPLVERTKQIQRVGERVLWGQTAAAMAYAFADVSPTAMQDTALFTSLLPFPELAGVGEDETVWRSTCCLAFASPSLTACHDCVTRARRPARKLPNPMARLRRRGGSDSEN